MRVEPTVRRLTGMFVNFFIDRSIFASVLAIVVAGAVATPFLPIAMFPQITLPQVVVLQLDRTNAEALQLLRGRR